jgi:hypothetical protein
VILVAEAREQMAALEAKMRTPARASRQIDGAEQGEDVAGLEADLARRRATWAPEHPAGAPALDVARVQRAVDAALGGRPAARLGYAEGMQMIAALEGIVRSPQLTRLPEPRRRAILLEVQRLTLILAALVREAVRPRARPAVYATTYPPRRRSPLASEWRR